MKELSSIQSHAWNVEYDFMDANLAKASGLVGLLERFHGSLKDEEVYWNL